MHHVSLQCIAGHETRSNITSDRAHVQGTSGSAHWSMCGALARIALGCTSREFPSGVHLGISTSMRRIPRPSRAIDPSAPLCSSVRPRISPCPSPCRAVVLPCTHLRTSTAAFSSAPARAFLLSGKPDKRKHQQFVRKWQKRLLGDSEPIGAHVDPYDPTSPVRIAPEEQGEYEEVLEEERRRTKHAQRTTSRRKIDTSPFQRYIPAEELGQDRPGHTLRHVGGEEWLQQKQEGDMAKEFEKLTLQTYTPLTLEMASEIEDLTGTPYTLRDGNLMLAQTVHQETGRPYTKYKYATIMLTTFVESFRVRDMSLT
jgi:hypothetical protein